MAMRPARKTDEFSNPLPTKDPADKPRGMVKKRHEDDEKEQKRFRWEFFSRGNSYLGVRPSTIYAMVKRKGIPHYKVGRLVRFKKFEIDEWMAGQREAVVDVRMEARRVITTPWNKPGLAVNEIVKKAIDGAGKKRYISRYGEPDQSKGLGKEVEHGSI